jgi:predicted nucleic acid-binding protein
VVVSDTTPLNYLVLIEAVEILPDLFGNLIVPPAVLKEMQHPKAPAAVAEWAGNPPSWIEIRAPKSVLPLKIGAGEDEAISLALEIGDAALLIDDKRARAATRVRGLETIGTIGVLELADSYGLLNFESALFRLERTSFRSDAIVIEEARQRIRGRRKM